MPNSKVPPDRPPNRGDSPHPSPGENGPVFENLSRNSENAQPDQEVTEAYSDRMDPKDPNLNDPESQEDLETSMDYSDDKRLSENQENQKTTENQKIQKNSKTTKIQKQLQFTFIPGNSIGALGLQTKSTPEDLTDFTQSVEQHPFVVTSPVTLAKTTSAPTDTNTQKRPQYSDVAANGFKKATSKKPLNLYPWIGKFHPYKEKLHPKLVEQAILYCKGENSDSELNELRQDALFRTQFLREEKFANFFLSSPLHRRTKLVEELMKAGTNVANYYIQTNSQQKSHYLQFQIKQNSTSQIDTPITELLEAFTNSFDFMREDLEDTVNNKEKELEKRWNDKDKLASLISACQRDPYKSDTEKLEFAKLKKEEQQKIVEKITELHTAFFSLKSALLSLTYSSVFYNEDLKVFSFQYHAFDSTSFKAFYHHKMPGYYPSVQEIKDSVINFIQELDIQLSPDHSPLKVEYKPDKTNNALFRLTVPSHLAKDDVILHCIMNAHSANMTKKPDFQLFFDPKDYQEYFHDDESRIHIFGVLKLDSEEIPARETTSFNSTVEIKSFLTHCSECATIAHSRFKCPNLVCKICHSAYHMGPECPRRRGAPKQQTGTTPFQQRTNTTTMQWPQQTVASSNGTKTATFTTNPPRVNPKQAFTDKEGFIRVPGKSRTAPLVVPTSKTSTQTNSFNALQNLEHDTEEDEPESFFTPVQSASRTLKIRSNTHTKKRQRITSSPPSSPPPPTLESIPNTPTTTPSQKFQLIFNSPSKKNSINLKSSLASPFRSTVSSLPSTHSSLPSIHATKSSDNLLHSTSTKPTSTLPKQANITSESPSKEPPDDDTSSIEVMDTDPTENRETMLSPTQDINTGTEFPSSETPLRDNLPSPNTNDEDQMS